MRAWIAKRYAEVRLIVSQSSPIVWRWVAANAHNLIFSIALLGVGVGFALAWMPLGLIVPGLLVIALMTASRFRGGSNV